MKIYCLFTFSPTGIIFFSPQIIKKRFAKKFGAYEREGVIYEQKEKHGRIAVRGIQKRDHGQRESGEHGSYDKGQIYDDKRDLPNGEILILHPSGGQLAETAGGQAGETFPHEESNGACRSVPEHPL